MTATRNEHEDASSIVGRYLIPSLGLLAMLFSLFTGVPWLSKAEWALNQATRDQQWKEQAATNLRVDKHLDAHDMDTIRLDLQIRELRDAMQRAGMLGAPALMDLIFRILLIGMLLAIWWQAKQVHELVNSKYTALETELRDAKALIADLRRIFPIPPKGDR